MSETAYSNIAGWIEDRTHILPLRVYYEHTDLTGLVYHGNYVRWMESGRSDFLRLLGLSHKQLLERDQPIAWTITHLAMDFKCPARIDDLLHVKTRYNYARGARLNAAQEIFCGEKKLIQAKIDTVCIDLAGKPKRLPSDIEAILQKVICLD